MLTLSTTGHGSVTFCCDDLIRIFNQCFLDAYNTILVAGGNEPFYTPEQPTGEPATIVFTHNYFSSALHEVSHWCIAGAERRQQNDYGYWYAPDGRTPEQQLLFEQVEIKPQAQEWVFNVACSRRFYVSVDNVSRGLGVPESFKESVVSQARVYCDMGLNGRARQFAKALSEFYGVRDFLLPHHYQAKQL